MILESDQPEQAQSHFHSLANHLRAVSVFLSSEDEASSGTSLRFSRRLSGSSPSAQSPGLQGALLWGRAGLLTPIVMGGRKSLSSIASMSPEDG